MRRILVEFEVISDFDDSSFHVCVGIEFLLQACYFMDKAGVVQNLQHELLSVTLVAIQYSPGAGHALFECFSVEDGRLEISHVSPQVVWQFANVSNWKLVGVLVGRSVVLQRVVE